ncbi:MAG: S24/S26 family peptidase [Sandaracinaceae bacterium]|nr:S24/S26 family peptidase [Myxococcales bacterium]MCB9658372.1 S24/S26 family peptidase [Sandaracinaceae bacterium]
MAAPPSSAFGAAHRAAVAELLSEPGSDSAAFRVTVRGHCMTPALLDGQVVRVTRSAWPLPGDIVAFRRGREDPGLAVHRFLGVRVGRRGLLLVTQADNEPHADPAFQPARLAGVAQVSVPLPVRLRAVGRWACALWPRPRRSPRPVSPSTPR